MPTTNDRTVIFDLGNVVLFFDHRITCKRLAEYLKLKPEIIYRKIFKEGIEKQFDEGTVSPKEFTKKCSDALKVKLNEQEFKRMWSDIFWENLPVIDIIKELRSYSKVLLLSNTNTWHFDYAKKHFGITDLFDEFILSFRVGCTKPNKKIFDLAVAKSSHRTRIPYFDDIEEYAKAATKAGLFGIRYQTPSLLRDLLIREGFLK